MSWFKRAPTTEASRPLPKNDDPAIKPRPKPKLSEARAAAIEKLIKTGYERDGVHRPVRDVRHALFLAAAGVLELPA